MLFVYDLIILCTIYVKIVQSINKILVKLDEILFLMWIKFKCNVFIFMMIYWNYVKECVENYFFFGYVMEGILFNLVLVNRFFWNILIFVDLSYIYFFGVVMFIVLIWILSDV